MNHLKFILLCLAGWINREQQATIEYLQEEINVLLEIHGKKPRFTDRQRKRLAVKAKKIRFGKLAQITNLVSPHTLRTWLRKLVASKYDSSKKRSSGRPSTAEEIAKFIVQMATENETWGYTRIRDAMNNLGHYISRDTVANILKDNGIEPAPERGSRTTWAAFLKQHWEVMAATDFFTVEAFTPKGIIRYQVLFVIRLATREVHIAGICDQGNGRWMEQIARNLTDAFNGFLTGYHFIIHDRDPLFTKLFSSILKSAGIKSIRLPRNSPNLNAYSERFVKSIKHECLNRMVIFSEPMLQHVVKEYMVHYHEDRNHQGIDSNIIKPNFENSEPRNQLGGLLKFYGRKAA